MGKINSWSELIFVCILLSLMVVAGKNDGSVWSSGKIDARKMSSLGPIEVNTASGIVRRRVSVDRTITPQDALTLTGHHFFCVYKDVLAAMPKGNGDEVEVWFIPIKGHLPTNNISAFLARYGLVADPRAQAAANEDPKFSMKYPNVTQWGTNYYLWFGKVYGGRLVYCSHHFSGWNEGTYIAGVPASRK